MKKDKFSFSDKREMLDWLKANLSQDEKRFITRNSNPFNKSYKPVFIFDLQGNKLFSCASLLEAGKVLGTNHQSIRYAVYKKSIYLEKYVISFVDKFELPPRKYKPYKGQNDKACFAYNVEGVIFKKFDSISKAAAHFGCPRHSLDHAIKRKSLTHYGYYFSLSDKFELPIAGKYNRNPLLRFADVNAIEL